MGTYLPVTGCVLLAVGEGALGRAKNGSLVGRLDNRRICEKGVVMHLSSASTSRKAGGIEHDTLALLILITRILSSVKNTGACQ